MESKRVTIQVQSVVYKNEFESLKSAVAAMANAVRVYNELDGGDCHLTYVCGDGSPAPVLTDAQVQFLRDEYGKYVDFKYTIFGENTGSAKGHNWLAKGADAEYLTIMNPDVKVSPHFLREILKPFSDPTVAMVEARQTPFEHQKEYDAHTLETEWATTACCLIRRTVFEELKGFDSDTFFLYCDDLDFSWRLRLAGYRIIYQPLAPVFHGKELTITGGWKPTTAEKYYSAEAALLMAHKWSNPKRVTELLKTFENGDENCQKAVREFLKRKKEGRLPQSIDPEHKIARFNGDYYSENRFVL